VSCFAIPSSALLLLQFLRPQEALPVSSAISTADKRSDVQLISSLQVPSSLFTSNKIERLLSFKVGKERTATTSLLMLIKSYQWIFIFHVHSNFLLFLEIKQHAVFSRAGLFASPSFI
jgi:hypothetical protein